MEPDISLNAVIRVRPVRQRFWVVRASGGHYVQHFRQAGAVAVGHLNDIPLRDGDVIENFPDGVEAALVQASPHRAKSSIRSHANQVKSLVVDMKEGDMVVTLDPSQLSVGIVSGPAYITNSPYVIRNSRGDWEMPHKLRRSVRWGPAIPRRLVPVALEMSLFAHQTVFNIDDHWESVYHLLYPCFRFGDSLYLSTNIRQQDGISNYFVAQLFRVLSGIEAAAAALAETEGPVSYAEALNKFEVARAFTLTTRAEFMSPGTVWSKLKADHVKMLWASLIFVMVFGGDTPVIKTDGLITKEMRERALEVAIEIFKQHKVSDLSEYLRLELPQVDTRALDGMDVHVG